jgi:uncharacterized protein Usg
MNLDSLRVHQSEANWTEILKTFVDVLSGQAHNRQLNETLKLILELQALSKPVAPSEAVMRSFQEFYHNQLLLYLHAIQPQPQNILTLLFPEEEPDPRTLAMDDTAKLLRVYYHLAGTDPEANERRTKLIEQIITNLTSAIQTNSVVAPDREKLARVIEFMQRELSGTTGTPTDAYKSP